MKNLLQNIILGLILISCNCKESKIPLPIINDSIPQSKSLLNVNKMLEGGYLLIGITKLGEDFNIKNLDKKDDEYLSKYIRFIDSTENKQTLDIEEIIEIEESPNNPTKLTTQTLKELKYVESTNLKIYVDTNQVLNMPNYKDNLELNKEIKKGTKSFDEYSNAIKDSYAKYYKPSKNLKQSYTVLFYNKSDSIIPIETKEGWLYMIQEAKDNKGNWKPIEYYNPHTFCGNSFGFSYLLPNHYAISKIYKYTGVFKTKMRLKFTTNSNVYYSNEFMGEINLEQFDIPYRINEKPINVKRYFFFNN